MKFEIDVPDRFADWMTGLLSSTLQGMKQNLKSGESVCLKSEPSTKGIEEITDFQPITPRKIFRDENGFLKMW